MIESKILLDSINVCGDRITTYLATFNRYILSEVNTHRMLSRNSASSRAIPVKKMIKSIVDNPAMPVFWGKNQSGMQSVEELDPEQIEQSKKIWLEARDDAIEQCNKLIELGLHKQIANRILEPWCHTTTLITATEWDNFFALRAHKDAQPEFAELALKMLEQYNQSEPRLLKPGEWHIPFGDNLEGVEIKDRLKVCVARAARTSYVNIDKITSIEEDAALCDRLVESGHVSPLEHSAMALDKSEFHGNFKGWLQYRKTISGENRSDSRVQRKSI